MELTMASLIELTRTHAGEVQDGALDGDIIDVLFGNLGYDSVALLEVLSQIRNKYGIDLADDATGTARTPRQLLETVNSIILMGAKERFDDRTSGPIGGHGSPVVHAE